MPQYWDTYFGAALSDTDPAVAGLIRLEEQRQAERIILIPSESIAPAPVRAALGSVYNNIYAEGYPASRTMRDDEALLLDIGHQMAHYRRYGDRRFYKGAELVNIVESLAQRRCAECLANDLVAADELFVNVQPLSGAPANLAVYEAIMRPGETLMGMDLYQGGHLTHGSQFNISGKRYNVASYGVAKDGRLDYEAIMRQALEARPRVLIAGYTSYPWAPDWAKFREIADACGAYLMADIAHPAGLVIAGAYPSPVGYADVVTFTTHKTLCGPRGAVIVTADEGIARKVNAAVFPGAQGGPHTHKFAAMAVAFGIARTGAFHEMMHRIIANARALAESLRRRGLTLAYGGTDTHLLLVDLRSVETPNKEPLRGEVAVRIMDLAGLVTNKNTIPGDSVTALGSGVRLGTPWVTQRGMGAAEMDVIADATARLVTAIHPFHYQGLTSELPRGKIEPDVLEAVRRDVAALARGAATDVPAPAAAPPNGPPALLVSGKRARPFLCEAGTACLADLEPREMQRTLFLDADGKVVAGARVIALEVDERGRERFLVATAAEDRQRLQDWLQGLSDGYAAFDREDVYRKVAGPVVVRPLAEDEPDEEVEDAWATLEPAARRDSPVAAGAEALSLYRAGADDSICLTKPYFVGRAALRPALPASDKSEFAWEPVEAPPRRTPLYEEHRKLTRQIIPFAGWEMPVWYSSVGEEHRAVRQAAGLFDVSHMGVFGVSGGRAAAFLDAVGSNYAAWLQPGQSHYSYLLDPDGNVIDDIMVYHVDPEYYILIVNAANAEKDLAWLWAVNEGSVVIDRDNPAMEVQSKVILADLKDPAMGAGRLVDVALQGPASLAILQALTDDAGARRALARLKRTEVTRLTLAGMDLIVARTGYTGEDVGYEIMVHPDEAVRLWRELLRVGEPFGIRPCGLAARDSTRIEAGLPLYGHELDGPLGVLPQEAGFPSYLKAHKAFYIGRDAVMARAAASKRQVVRFRVNEAGARALRGGEHGEAVVNRRGAYVGRVTSAALVEGVQTGLALVDRRSAQVGTQLAIYPAAPAGRGGAPARPEDLAEGDSVVLPVWATVLSRFPERRGEADPDRE